MNPKQLSDIIPNTQTLINAYLKRKPNETISSVAKGAGIHPAQLLLFMRGERGLTTKSLSKIGEFLINNA